MGVDRPARWSEDGPEPLVGQHCAQQGVEPSAWTVRLPVGEVDLNSWWDDVP
jgi:hypothetical protein